MCKQCYEQYVKQVEKIMLFCKLKIDGKSEMDRLCICQRFCSDKGKYIPHNQKNGCKSYEE